MLQPQFYIMRRRHKFGCTPTQRDKLLSDRMNLCPGWIGHDHPRKEIVFRNWCGRGNKAYPMYWRVRGGQK